MVPAKIAKIGSAKSAIYRRWAQVAVERPTRRRRDLSELLATAWHFDQRVRCTAGHVVGVLTRLANDTGPDPLADGKSRSIRSRISGGTKWLGLRSKSKSPKFGADRKHYYPDDDTA